MIAWWLAVASSDGSTGCEAERAPLALGERQWFVEAGAWRTATAELSFGRGFAFSVAFDGEEVGVVVVGEIEHAIVARGDQALSLQRALSIELGQEVAALPWSVEADVAWGLSADQIGAWTGDWTPIAPSDRVLLDLAAEIQPAILVVDYRDYATARRIARRAVADRSVALAAASYPIRSVVDTLGTTPGTGWQLIEARSALPVGQLAGASRDPWISTLIDDPVLDAGRRAHTVSLGTRYVEGLSGG